MDTTAAASAWALTGLLVLAATASGGAPTVVHWASPVSGGWTQPDRWSPALVPDNANGGPFHAVIDALGGQYVVAVENLSPTIDSLTIDAEAARLVLRSGAILQTDALQLVAGSIAVEDDAALVVTGDLACAGLIECIDAGAEITFSGPPLWTNDGVISTSSGTISIAASVVVNNGLLASTTTMQIDAFVLVLNEGRLRTGGHQGAVLIQSDLAQGTESAIEIGVKTVFPPHMSSGSIEILGHASLDGALLIYAVNTIHPAMGNEWDVLRYESHSGDFSSFSFPELDSPDHVWWAEPGETRYRIGVRHIADLDHDGLIGFTDVNIVLGAFNTPGGPAQGDIDGDGFIDFADLNHILSLFNTYLY